MRRRSVVIAVFSALAVAGCGGSSSAVQISFLSFIQQVRAGNVRSISGSGRAIQGTFKHPVTYPPTSQNRSDRFTTQIPTFTPAGPLRQLLRQERVKINGPPG